MTAIPVAMSRYDLEMVAELLQKTGYQIEDKGVMVTAISNDKEITIYPTGRMFISGVSGKDEAVEVAEITYSIIASSREY